MTTDTAPSVLQINADGNGGKIGSMNLHEFIILNYTGTPTKANYQSDAEKLEGYLCSKWGLTGLLPETHIYKNARPSS